MTDIKSIPSMSKAELIKEVERLASVVRSQSAAMTELGKLSDMQQARIAALEGNVQMAGERVTFFEVSGKWAVVVDRDRDHEYTVYNLPSRNVAEFYRRGVIAKLTATEPRP